MTKKPSKPTPAGRRMMTVRVKTAKRRKTSSNLWLKRQLNDPYVIQAKEDGYRSRAAYKLKELNETLKFLKKKCRVVDLGATPGGWTQVVLEEVDIFSPATQVVALDMNPMEPLPGSIFLHLDFTLPEAVDALRQKLTGPVDVVLSDMAPPASGHAQTDHLRIIGLVEMALDFALQVLAPGGIFVAKVWQGGSDKEMLATLKKNFTKVKHIKPPASRKDSAETYVVAQGFKGRV
ncbi:MAG: 23S rRNA methyltransferase [Alphaproteobacteria bacterium RIFCSPHIGHO2_01_FULL_41_14]|nr:MAG: 23S rRNA methyltransferase [Alphaproteobacteria bacterium RIFCSPHIGHO2_01_FULL_41_14]HCI48501.1 23S rRNA methyltransferase [Holosporales bacterium]